MDIRRENNEDRKRERECDTKISFSNFYHYLFMFQIFDTDLNLLNTIENRAFHTINDMAMLRDGTLVLASSYALYHVTTGGEQLELIKYGNFKSACVVNEKMFVYKSQPGKPCVLVYVYNGVWNMESSFDLPFGGFVTLSAHRDTLTACSPNKGQLYRLNSKGKQDELDSRCHMRKKGVLSLC